MWWQEEMRPGQKNGRVRQLARMCIGPRQPADQRYIPTDLFCAVCQALRKAPGGGAQRNLQQNFQTTGYSTSLSPLKRTPKAG